MILSALYQNKIGTFWKQVLILSDRASVKRFVIKFSVLLFEGTVIVGITANVDSSATNIYYTAMNALDYPYYTYEQLIEGLVAEGAAETTGLYAFEFGEPYIFFGVAEDEDGNYTKVWSSKEITFTKASCSPAEEFFTANASAQQLKANTPHSPKQTLLSQE